MSTSLKRKYSKLTKLMEKANTAEREFLDQVKLEITFDEIKSLKTAVDEHGTEDDKSKYNTCYEHYNNGQITVGDYEVFVYSKKQYGKHTKEHQIKESILARRCLNE